MNDTVTTPPLRPLYVFLDEGGNLDFSPSGTRYFTLTGVTLSRPFPCDSELHALRFDLIETGLDIEYFHASEDRQPVRDKVFEIVRESLSRFRADSIIVEKRKTGPSFREDAKFYPHIVGYLLRYIVNAHDLSQWSEVIVITDRIPVSRKRQAVEKAVKQTLAMMLPSEMRYRVLHHDSKSCAGLQIADYFNWAIYRAWDKGDRRSLELVLSGVRSQFEIFQRGGMIWY